MEFPIGTGRSGEALSHLLSRRIEHRERQPLSWDFRFGGPNWHPYTPKPATLGQIFSSHSLQLPIPLLNAIVLRA
jgi:hypothetical protein